MTQKQRTGTYKGSTKAMKHVHEVLQLLSVLADDKRFSDIIDNRPDGSRKEIGTMCDVLDEIERRGEERGEKRGERRGERRGEEKTAKLMWLLLSSGRNEDIEKASKDKAFRNQLFREFADQLGQNVRQNNPVDDAAVTGGE